MCTNFLLICTEGLCLYGAPWHHTHSTSGTVPHSRRMHVECFRWVSFDVEWVCIVYSSKTYIRREWGTVMHLIRRRTKDVNSFIRSFDVNSFIHSTLIRRRMTWIHMIRDVNSFIHSLTQPNQVNSRRWTSNEYFRHPTWMRHRTHATSNVYSFDILVRREVQYIVPKWWQRDVFCTCRILPKRLKCVENFSLRLYSKVG